MSEAYLVQRMAARDESAMGEFYDSYGRTLYGVLLRIVRCPQQAEDTLQEAMVKIWCCFDGYDAAKGTLFTWALNVCRNTAIDYLRSRAGRKSARTQPLQDADLSVLADLAFCPEHVGVAELLKHLRPKDIRIIELIYFQGFTQAEAAEALKLPLGTVKTCARRAIQDLARLCQDAHSSSMEGLPVAVV